MINYNHKINKKGGEEMSASIVKETTDVLKKLSPKNQLYFMTLVRLAAVAEEGIKEEKKEKAGV